MTESERRPRYRILILDDNEPDQLNMQRMLARVGAFEAVVAVCSEADEGLERLLDGDFDCALVDHRLGVHTGLEIVELARSKGCDTAIVAVTGFGRDRLAVEMLNAGAQDYLSKGDLSPEALEQSILIAVDKVDVTRRLRAKQIELETFVSAVSHDLKQPAAVVKSNAELLRDFFAQQLGGQGMEFVEALVRTGERMSQMLDALTQFSRFGRESEPASAVELEDCLTAALENLGDDIRRAGCEIRRADLPAVRGHRESLIQLLQNLIANAIKYRSDEAPTISIYASRNNGRARVSVRDNGIGFDPEAAEVVFLPFRRLKTAEPRDGLGFGLAMCKRIVEYYGGSIGCESEAGCGSTFWFELPLARPDGVETNGRSKRVLLVDDERDLTTALGEILRRRGHHVKIADDLEAARKALSEGRTDVAVVDLLLHGESGLDLIDSLKRDGNGRVGVVAMSGGGSGVQPGPLLDQARRLGADKILAKPVGARDLLLAIQTAANGRIPRA